MATELLQPGVSVIQEFRSVSPTIVTPTLVPCAIAPAFQVLEALEQDATGNSVLNTDAAASVPPIITSENPGDFAALDGLTLAVSVNNGAPQVFTFSDPTSLNLSAGQVKDQINSSSPAPTGFGVYVAIVGASEYVQIRGTGTGAGQFLKILGGTANSILGFNENWEAEGVGSYNQVAVQIQQANFPDPRGIIDELDIDESSIRAFVSVGGANLKEFNRDESFLRKHKGATYVGGTITYGSFNTTKFAFKNEKGGDTFELTFASEPADIASLVIAMQALSDGAAITGITWGAYGTVLTAASSNGYFEVVTPSATSAHADLGWTNGDLAYTVQPVDDNDGDTRTPFVEIWQENFNSPYAEASVTSSSVVSGNVAVHNKTFEVSVDGGLLQEISFDGGPIVGSSDYDGTVMNGLDLAFTVNGVSYLCTFATADAIALADAVAEINVVAGTTVAYASDATGAANPAGPRISLQLGGATAIAGGSVTIVDATSTALTMLGFATGADILQTLTEAEIITAINVTMGAGFAVDDGGKIKLESTTNGDESKIVIGLGTANADLFFTNSTVYNGTPFAPRVGDALWAEGSLVGYIAAVMPGGYNNRLKLDREVATTAWGKVSYYIQALNISSLLPSDRPKPDLVVNADGSISLKHDFLRDTEGEPIVAEGSLIIAYTALRLDVTSAANNPSILTLESTEALEDALEPINTDNPLGLMLYFMLINAPGVAVTGLGVDGTDSSNPDGTPLAFSKALGFLESEEVYALAPSSQDPTVHQIFMTHVNSMSDPDAKGERIVFISPEMPGEALPDLVTSGTDGDSTPTTNEFETKLPTLASDILNAGVDPVGTIPVSDGLFLDIAGDAKRYNISAISGTKVSIRVAFSPGENDDAYFSTNNLPDGLISETFSINVRGLPLVDSNGDPDYSAIAEEYQKIGNVYGNRRVIMVAPEEVGANIDGLEQKIKGYYLCAGIAGMVGQQPPQQGFTNFPITGYTQAFGSNDVFNQRQMNVGAAGGTYWVVQLVAGGPLTCRHQLTTDLTSIETRELSITKVVDFTAKFMRGGLRNFIGKFNITQPFLDTLSTVVQGQLSFLTESGVIIGGELNNVVQDETAPDTVLIDVTLDVPYPCNYIRLTLVI